MPNIYDDLADNTPVLVGIGNVSQRIDDNPPLSKGHNLHSDLENSQDALELMLVACHNAEHDSGSALLPQADTIIVPQGFWHYNNPAAYIKEQINAKHAKTVLTHIGILQQTAVRLAAERISCGESHITMIVAGEAQNRNNYAKRRGVELTPRTPDSTLSDADEILKPVASVQNDLEITRGLVFPVSAYAIIENALSQRCGLNLAKRQNDIDKLWSNMSRIASHNPDAWSNTYLSPQEIRQQSLMAFPYTRSHVSQWNVDQAVALILCSAKTAKQHNIPPTQWLFPWFSAEANDMQDLSERAEIGRCMGIEQVAAALHSKSGVDSQAINYWNLYSCFPVAVRLQLEALDLGKTQQPSVSGGMSFAGGPLNHYSLQSLVPMARLLRQTPNSIGAVSSVSGLLHKYGIGLWGAMPAPQPWQHVECGQTGVMPKCMVDGKYQGKAKISGWTINYKKAAPQRAIIIADTPAGKRCIGFNDNQADIAKFLDKDLSHSDVMMHADGHFQWLQ